MNLTWHIVKKDVRRLAAPVAAWIALVLAGALIVRCSAVPGDVVLSGDVNGWLRGLRSIVSLLGVLEVVLAAVLVAFLVQEDALVGTEAAWLTRPIGRGRLFLAKAGAAGLMLIVAPVAVLTPVWLASGFSAGEWLGAAGEFVLWQVATIVVAGAIAAITADLGKFVIAAVGLALAAMLIAMTSFFDPAKDYYLAKTRMVLLWGGLALLSLAVVRVQFGTRKTRVAWTVVGVGLALLFAVRVAWPWDLSVIYPEFRGQWPTKADPQRRAKVTVEKIVVPIDQALPRPTFVQVAPLAAADEFVAPWGGSGHFVRADKREVRVAFERGGLWGEEAAKRLVGMTPKTGAVTWDLATSLPANPEVVEAGVDARMWGMLRVARMRGRVMVEMPLRAGEKSRTGSSFTRVVSIAPLGNSARYGVVIEEREAWLAAVSGFDSGSQLSENDPARKDCFLLVNRAKGIFKCLHIVEGGALKRSSLLLTERTLEFDPPVQVVDGKRVPVKDWEREAVLVKVRFETLERWMADFTNEGVRVVAEEKNL